MRCEGCGRDIPALTEICPYCGLDYKKLNECLIKESLYLFEGRL